MNGIFGQIIIIGDALGCPDSDHKYVACDSVSRMDSIVLQRHHPVEFFARQINIIYLNAGSFEFLVFPEVVVVRSFNFCRVKNGFQFFYAFADRIDAVAVEYLYTSTTLVLFFRKVV